MSLQPLERKAELIEAIKREQRLRDIEAELARRRKLNRLAYYYPDEDTLAPDGRFYHARRKYQKQLQFFALGATHKERGFMAANRVGKTEGAGGYETALHLTGRYPDWWEGKRFDRPVNWLCAGITTDETRDVIQAKLVGPPARKDEWGTALLPADTLGRVTRKMGVADALDVVSVRHMTGGWSSLQFRSSDQGREKFQGTERDGIWLDEECPPDIYSECVTRTMTTGGIVMLTFTPLKGLSEVALMFMPELAPVAA